MKSSEILELVRAGYTKAEIAAMDGSTEQDEGQPSEAVEDQGQAAPETDDKPVTVDQRFDTINATLDKMVKTMQQMAIRESKQPGDTSRTPEQVLEDIAKMYN